MGDKPRLFVVTPEAGPEIFDRLVARDVRAGKIRQLRAMRRALKYIQVELFFQEALDGRQELSDLADDELSALRDTIDRAIDNFHTPDGVDYYEAGLLRSHG